VDGDPGATLKLMDYPTDVDDRWSTLIELLEGAGVMFENRLTDVELWDADDAIGVLDRISSDPIRDAISQLQQTR
jgi:hypothetical protein